MSKKKLINIEQNKDLRPAFINEKDVCSDFIYNMFDGVGEFIGHISKTKFHIVGYWNGRLIEVTWGKYSNRIAFAFVDLMENYHTPQDEERLFDFIKNVDTGSTGLMVEAYQSGDWILSDWYFAE